MYLYQGANYYGALSAEFHIQKYMAFIFIDTICLKCKLRPAYFSAYNKVYGSIGTVLIVMTLIYINALILLIGFELNVSIEVLRKEQDQEDYFN